MGRLIDLYVIPAQAGIHIEPRYNAKPHMDPRLRGGPTIRDNELFNRVVL